MTRTIFFMAMAAASTAFAAGGQVYKWTDAQGVVHYSDAPPPTTQSNVQTVRVTGGDRPHDVGSSTPAEPDAAPPQQPGQNQVAQNAPSDFAKNCATARSNLELLQSKFQVNVTDANGKAVALDDKSRQVQIADMNAQISLYCK